MAIKNQRPVTPSRRFTSFLSYDDLAKLRPEKRLIKILHPKGGRNASGKVTVRHQGGGEKRYLRLIDYKRDKKEVPAKVVSLEYDPNRTANIALLHYADGEKRYILAPLGLAVGQEIMAGESVEIKTANTLSLARIPVGTIVHNIELMPGKGGQLARGAGVGATIVSKEANFAVVKLPSGEERKLKAACLATVGQVGNVEWRTVKLGKAGRKIHLGIRPTVRGVAQHPDSHPHGGGEGRSGIGMPSPKSPWGKKTLGKRTRKRSKYSNKLILRRR